MSRATPLSPEERRQAIIEATLPLLLTHGLELSTKEIAKAACIAEGTIFRAFETKAELVHATLEVALRPTQAIAALAALPEDQPLIDRLAAILQIMSEEIRRTRSLFAAVFGSRPPEGPPKPPPTKAHSDRFDQIRQSLVTALTPYTDQLSIPLSRAVQLITAVPVAANMFDPNQELEDPTSWAETIAYGIAKGNQ